jgi:hypothetical protein
LLTVLALVAPLRYARARAARQSPGGH